MSQPDPDVDCPSKEPDGRFYKRLFKKMLWNLADEGTKSIGRYLVIGIIIIVALTYIGGIVDSFFGWFGGWFDWLPFIGGDSAPEPTPASAEAVDESDCTIWGRNVPAFLTPCK